jgi:hypothetical protein
VRQALRREHGIDVRLRTVERAVSGFRRELSALARATVRFETPPGKQLQVDFGETRILVGDERPKVSVFVATIGYSRRPDVAAFLLERPVSWIAGLEGTFRHFNGITEEVLVTALGPRARTRAASATSSATPSPVARSPRGTPSRRTWPSGSVLVTSNLTTSEWGTVFGDPVVATAILDRFRHHSHVVTIRGDSYRLRGKRKSGLLRPVTAT